MPTYTNYIKLFGENVNDLDNQNGKTFLDSDWATRGLTPEQIEDEIEAGNYRSVRQTGFRPNQPVSSLALNTALRQASVGAKMIGDILIDPELGIYSNNIVTDGDEETLKDNIDNYVTALKNYLIKINQLISGEEIANRAFYAETKSADPNTINNRLITLNNTFNDYKTRLESGEIQVGLATYYYNGSANIDINTKLTQLESDMSVKSSTVAFPHVAGGPFNIYKQGGVVYSGDWETAVGNGLQFMSGYEPDVTNYMSVQHIGTMLSIGSGIIPSGYRPLVDKEFWGSGCVRTSRSLSQTYDEYPILVRITNNGSILIWILHANPYLYDEDIHLYLKNLRLNVGYNLT